MYLLALGKECHQAKIHIPTNSCLQATNNTEIINYLRGDGTIKLLFICSRNRWRSLTAETIFHGVNGYDVRSAGTEDKARVKVTSGHIGWADLIFAMEKKHVRRLQERFRDILEGKKIVCLNIPDDYQFMDSELIEVLISSVSEHIDLPLD